MISLSIASFAIAIACLLILLSTPARLLLLDRPNERSLHVVPVPKTGGIAIVAGVAGPAVFYGGNQQGPLAIALGLAAVSFCDDLLDLPVLLRLASHLVAATGIVWILASDASPIVQLALALGIAWMTNLFNFMDGSDGIAGGMAVIGFGACAIAAQAEGIHWISVTCASIAAAALAFLLFNFPPARIFMGDTGSIPLGFLAGAIGVDGWKQGAWPLWFPLLVFSPFAADATATLAKRAWRGARVWKAHREHYYQRLVQSGYGKRRTALAEYALMAICAGVALGTRNASVLLQSAALAGLVMGYCLLGRWIDHRWARHGTEAAQ